MNDPRETLSRIREQSDRATPGPWETDTSGHVLTAGDTPAFVARCADPDESDAGVPDAEFIAAARTTVPALLDLADAVLGLADDLDRDGNAFMSDADPGRAKAAYALAARIRAAITTALEGIR